MNEKQISKEFRSAFGEQDDYKPPGLVGYSAFGDLMFEITQTDMLDLPVFVVSVIKRDDYRWSFCEELSHDSMLSELEVWAYIDQIRKITQCGNLEVLGQHLADTCTA